MKLLCTLLGIILLAAALTPAIQMVTFEGPGALVPLLLTLSFPLSAAAFYGSAIAIAVVGFKAATDAGASHRLAHVGALFAAALLGGAAMGCAALAFYFNRFEMITLGAQAGGSSQPYQVPLTFVPTSFVVAAVAVAAVVGLLSWSRRAGTAGEATALPRGALQ